MQEMHINTEQFKKFRDVQIRPRWDWPATFSCNKHHEVFPYNAKGYTHEKEREYLQGRFPLLDQIVFVVLSERPKGGRFFIKDKGVFLKPKDDYIPIVQFIFK